MIVYNVTIKVEPETTGEWVNWMKEVHIPELLTLGIFTDWRLCRLLEQDDSDGNTYSAQYVCNSIDDYNRYISNHADAMREKTLKLFAGKFVAFRSIMEII